MGSFNHQLVYPRSFGSFARRGSTWWFEHKECQDSKAVKNNNTEFIFRLYLNISPRIIDPQNWLFWGPYPCYTGSNPYIGESKILWALHIYIYNIPRESKDQTCPLVGLKILYILKTILCLVLGFQGIYIFYLYFDYIRSLHPGRLGQTSNMTSPFGLWLSLTCQILEFWVCGCQLIKSQLALVFIPVFSWWNIWTFTAFCDKDMEGDDLHCFANQVLQDITHYRGLPMCIGTSNFPQKNMLQISMLTLLRLCSTMCFFQL